MRLFAELGGGVQSDRALAVVGRLGASNTGDLGRVYSRVPNGELGVLGDGVLATGVADRLLRQPALQSGRELAAGGGGANAGSALDVRRHRPVRSGALDLVRLAIAGAAHLLLGWVYLLVSPLCLPRLPSAAAKDNPFV